MLENARRQALLVLLLLVASLCCIVFMKAQLGPDLKGGNQLIYEIPEEALQKLEQTHITVDSVMEQTVAVVQERIDPTGVLDASVTRKGRSSLLIELGYQEKDQLDLVKRRISSLGKLEMRVVAEPTYIEGDVKFELDKERQRLEAWLNSGGRELVRKNWKDIERFNDDAVAGPLARPWLRWCPHLVKPDLVKKKTWDHSFTLDTQPHEGITPLGPSTVAVFDRATELNNGTVPESMAKQTNPFLLEFVAINWKERHFRGEDLDPGSVTVSVDGSQIAVTYSTRPELSGAYGEWSEKYVKKHSAIMLNGEIRSAPYLKQRINGTGQISGGFSKEEAEELVKVLRTGALQVEPVKVSERTTGPKLGEKALWLGQISLAAGAAAVFLFMLWYYRLAGVVACVTLVLNVLMIYAAVVFMQATITLPGLGGIVLTMGMAVDANVLIYERIREEADRGKDMVRSVRAGFERAMSAILDSNITTFLTGLVLYNAGVGPVRGFAVTLMVGIVTTVFTQFFVTRLLFHWLLVSNRLKEFKVHRLFAQPTFDYFRYAKRCVIGSAVLIVAGLAYATFWVPTEISLGIDFKGGANLQMMLQQPLTSEQLKVRIDADADFKRDFRNYSLSTLDPDESSRSHLFTLRLKLTDAMRAQIDQKRKDDRLARRAAAGTDAPLPPPYEPPYLDHLRRIFGSDLARPAWSNADVIKLPGQGNDASAQINLSFQVPVATTAVAEQLVKTKLSGAKVTPLADPSATQDVNFLVEWPTSLSTQPSQLFERIQEALVDLKDSAGKPVKLSNPFPEAEEIEGRMVVELRNAAIGALILSWVLIIFYLRVRFHEYKYGIAAVAALVHDVLVAHIVVVIFNYLGLVHAEISLNMIACYLTIIGYSVNDTIVIFDRIRENLAEEEKLGGRLTLRQIINLSVNQTMSRTILTTGVTLFVVLAQFVVNYGQESDLESFAFGMLIGMVSGTYSTVFIASPILTWIADRYDAKTPGAAVPATTK